MLTKIRNTWAALQDIPAYRSRLKKLEKQLKKVKRRRDSIGEVMAFAKTKGFVPQTVIDVGINTGTPGLYDHFSDAHYLLLDPLQESEVFMKAICSGLAKSNYKVAAAGREPGELAISVPASFGGTVFASIYRYEGVEDRKVPVITLDSFVKETGAEGPFIIKVDTEGSELEVLKGAPKTLEQTELIIMEARLRPIGSAPQFLEVLQELKQMGFVLYDAIDRNYHDRDKTLKQLDIVLVRENGYFRSSTKYRAFSCDQRVDLGSIHQHKLEERARELEKLQANTSKVEGKWN